MIVLVDMRRNGNDRTGLLVAAEASCGNGLRSIDTAKWNTRDTLEFPCTIVVYQNLWSCKHTSTRVPRQSPHHRVRYVGIDQSTIEAEPRNDPQCTCVAVHFA